MWMAGSWTASLAITFPTLILCWGKNLMMNPSDCTNGLTAWNNWYSGLVVKGLCSKDFQSDPIACVLFVIIPEWGNSEQACVWLGQEMCLEGLQLLSFVTCFGISKCGGFGNQMHFNACEELLCFGWECYANALTVVQWWCFTVDFNVNCFYLWFDVGYLWW